MADLTPAHRGYEYQDLLVACRLVDMLLNGDESYPVGESGFADGGERALADQVALSRDFTGDWLLDAIHERILPLEGHRPLTNHTLEELVRREKSGV